MINLAHGKCCSERWISLSSWDCDNMISPQDPNMPIAHSPACLMGKSHSAFRNYFPPIVILGSESFSQGSWFWVFFYFLFFYFWIFVLFWEGGMSNMLCFTSEQNISEGHSLKGEGFALHPLHACDRFTPKCNRVCLCLVCLHCCHCIWGQKGETLAKYWTLRICIILCTNAENNFDQNSLRLLSFFFYFLSIFFSS